MVPAWNQNLDEVEQDLAEQHAHFVREIPDSRVKGRKSWLFAYPDFHGIPVVLILPAFPTTEQVDAGNTAALGEAISVFKWLQKNKCRPVTKMTPPIHLTVQDETGRLRGHIAADIRKRGPIL